ncbi:DNA repair protein RecO C-terminal domain-containing protein [Geobacter argillaceus]|uniref:DNA repair protein RecO C-terminal domain-containing protein n=1 Tax=Geobacter argillaceus TaxID=345631 RepID=UPI00119E9AE6|nr:DNA repair protein RecO C-terminal domain-containing protein [Geobacter argillaceus]
MLAILLEHLDQAEACSSDRRFFEVNLLNILGYRPPIDACPGCGADLAATGGRLAGGGLHGIPCFACASGGRPVSSAAILELRQSLRTSRFGVVRFSGDLLAEAGELLDRAIASHLHRPIKSLAFLKEMELSG